MSQHTDRNRPKRLARRAATVSAGAFVLCLAGASPALADLDPGPLPDLSPVTDTVDPVTDAVDPIIPVGETVDQVEEELGLSDSTATAPKPTSPKITDSDGTTTTGHRTQTRDGGTTDRSRTARTDRLPGPAAVSPVYVPDWRMPASEMPGLRGLTTVETEAAEPPALAGAPTPGHGVISLAGGTLQDLGDPATPVGRTLLIVVSTLAIGTLAGGHVKAAQDRLARLA